MSRAGSAVPDFLKVCLSSRAGYPVAVAEVDDQGVQVGGERGLDGDGLIRERMTEAQGLGVQRLAVEPGLGAGLRAGAVNGIADDRVPKLGEVDADLVRPAGLEPARNQTGDGAEVLDHAVVRDGRPPLPRRARNPAPE